MAKVAILAFHFRPDEAIGAVRPENWGRWLAELHDVTVITRPAENWRNDNLPYRVSRPRSALIRIIDRLNHWRKQRKDALAKSRAMSKRVSPGVPTGALTYRMPCLYDVWFLSALRQLFKVNPDIVIATHSPYVALIVAWVYKIFRPRTRVCTDFRDLWTTGHATRGVPKVRLLERVIENRVLAKADVITTVSRGLAADFVGRGYGDKVHVIYNAPAADAFSESVGYKKNDADLVLCYTGNVYVGFQDPTPLFKLMARLHDTGAITPDKVRFVVASKNPGDLLAIAEREGVTRYVDFKGAVTRRESIGLQRNADVLVLLESGDPDIKGVLTGKVFEYLAVGKPILLIGPPAGSELHSMLQDHGSRIDLDAIERALVSRTPLPTCAPVDYSDISREQLMSVLEQLRAN